MSNKRTTYVKYTNKQSTSIKFGFAQHIFFSLFDYLVYFCLLLVEPSVHIQLILFGSLQLQI